MHIVGYLSQEISNNLFGGSASRIFQSKSGTVLFRRTSIIKFTSSKYEDPKESGRALSSTIFISSEFLYHRISCLVEMMGATNGFPSRSRSMTRGGSPQNQSGSSQSFSTSDNVGNPVVESL